MICNDFAFDGVSPGPFGHNTEYVDMALGTSGSIYIAGTYTDETGPKELITRLYANGLPYPSFGIGGTYILNSPTKTVTSIATNGSSLAIGSSNRELHRVNLNGFALGTNALSNGTSEIISNDNNFYILHPDFDSFTISAFNNSGNALTSFGNAGNVKIDYPEFRVDFSGSCHIALTLDGKFMVAMVQKVYPEMGEDHEIVIYRLLNDGTLDTTWGNNGILIEPEHKTYQIGDLLVNGNGKVVVTGNFKVEGEVTQLITHRWNDDGTFDTSFSGGGIAFHDDEVIVNSMVAAENHELLFVGKTDETDSKFVLGGYDNVGNNNSGFSTKKFLPTDPFIQNGSLEKFLLLPSGKLLACGKVTLTDGSKRGIVIRINSDGTLDTNFAENGVYMPNVVQQGADVSIAKQDDGKLVTVGGHAFDDTNGGLVAPAIARFLPNGKLDESFGYRGGSFNQNLGTDINNNPYSGVYKNVSILPNGKMMAFGQLGNERGFLLARYTAEGEPDVGFDGDGYMTVFGYTCSSGCKNRFGYGDVDSEGKIVLIVAAGSGNYPNPKVMRRLPNGTADPSFGPGGFGEISIDLSPVFEGFTTGTIFPDNSILAGGYVYKLPEAITFSTFAKITSNGNLDTSFGDNGVVYYKPEGSLGASNLIVKTQEDGSILSLFEYTDSDSKLRYGVVKLKSNGQIDTSFGTSGFIEFSPLDNKPRTVDGLNIDSKDNILITGSIQNIGGVTSKFDASGAFVKTYSYTLKALPTGQPLLTKDDQLVLVADGVREGFGIVCYNLETPTCAPGEEINILEQPASQVVDAGVTVTFSFVATGANLTYQWKKNEVKIPGETSATLVLSDVSMADKGLYYCVISNACDVQFTSSVILVVNVITGLEGPDQNNIMVYPNPSSGKIRFSENFAQNTILDIYGIDGEKISSISVRQGDNEVDISTLNNGLYLLMINRGNTRSVQRIIIQK